MKYRKLCKRLIAFTLCITIGIQSFFSSELPVYAGQSTPSAIDSLEGLLYEDSIDISDIEMYDDTGTKLIPVSLEVEEFNAQYVNLNPPIDSDSIPQTYSISAGITALSYLVGAITIALLFKAIIGISRKFCEDFRNYFVQYSYPSHERVFNDTPFSYTNSEGEKIETVITQEMMENLGAKLEAYEAGRIWEMVFLLTEEDKLCLTYTMYRHKALSNYARRNINVSKLDSSLLEKYPYYAFAANEFNSLYQYCFDKKPIGALYSTYSKNCTLYDYDGNEIKFNGKSLIFYSAYKLMYKDGIVTAYIDICKTATINYQYNSTLGIYETSNNFKEYDIGTGPSYESKIGYFPFNVFYLKSYSDVLTISRSMGKALSRNTPVFLGDDISVDNVINNGALIANTPRIGNVSDYYNALPKNLSIRKEFDINNVLNYGEGATALNPAGVLSWDDVIEKPTEIPTESVKPSESVQPSESVKPSEGTGGDSGTITITLTSILTKLSNLFDWIKANLTASAFATAVVSALGLTALFQTITTPLSSLLNYAISLSGKVADIASWDINAWIGALAAPLSHLLDIDNLVSDIANWDIDALINAVPKFLSIDTTLSALAKVIGTWNFADWPISMAQTLRDVLTHPLSALQTATDAIAKALDSVATWDLKTALKALENAITGALTGALTVAGITSIIDILTNIKDIALEAVGGSDDNSSDSNTDNDFFNFAKLLYILIAIIILLIILFLNCLRFIILIFSIPASTAFLNEDILKGIEYVKNLQVEKFNLSLYDIIVGVVYFLLFLAIIKAIRNKIDKIHI
ncbi:hypothetical protein [[Clostridium] symbiosum]|uniref:hypothetical protein n=1 Tax=Clostridium symbiosum TaxID=1512 RepID=UPI0034A57A4D